MDFEADKVKRYQAGEKPDPVPSLEWHNAIHAQLDFALKQMKDISNNNSLQDAREADGIALLESYLEIPIVEGIDVTLEKLDKVSDYLDQDSVPPELTELILKLHDDGDHDNNADDEGRNTEPVNDLASKILHVVGDALLSKARIQKLENEVSELRSDLKGGVKLGSIHHSDTLLGELKHLIHQNHLCITRDVDVLNDRFLKTHEDIQNVLSEVIQMVRISQRQMKGEEVLLEDELNSLGSNASISFEKKNGKKILPRILSKSSYSLDIAPLQNRFVLQNIVPLRPQQSVEIIDLEENDHKVVPPSTTPQETLFSPETFAEQREAAFTHAKELLGEITHSNPTQVFEIATPQASPSILPRLYDEDWTLVANNLRYSKGLNVSKGSNLSKGAISGKGPAATELLDDFIGGPDFVGVAVAKDKNHVGCNFHIDHPGAGQIFHTDHHLAASQSAPGHIASGEHHKAQAAGNISIGEHSQSQTGQVSRILTRNQTGHISHSTDTDHISHTDHKQVNIERENKAHYLDRWDVQPQQKSSTVRSDDIYGGEWKDGEWKDVGQGYWIGPDGYYYYLLEGEAANFQTDATTNKIQTCQNGDFRTEAVAQTRTGIQTGAKANTDPLQALATPIMGPLGGNAMPSMYDGSAIPGSTMQTGTLTAGRGTMVRTNAVAVPATGGAPRAPGMPGIVAAPRASGMPCIAAAPRASGMPGIIAAPSASGMPGIVGPPSASGMPGIVRTPGRTSGVPEAVGTPGIPGVPGSVAHANVLHAGSVSHVVGVPHVGGVSHVGDISHVREVRYVGKEEEEPRSIFEPAGAGQVAHASIVHTGNAGSLAHALGGVGAIAHKGQGTTYHPQQAGSVGTITHGGTSQESKAIAVPTPQNRQVQQVTAPESSSGEFSSSMMFEHDDTVDLNEEQTRLVSKKNQTRLVLNDEGVMIVHEHIPHVNLSDCQTRLVSNQPSTRIKLDENGVLVVHEEYGVDIHGNPVDAHGNPLDPHHILPIEPDADRTLSPCQTRLVSNLPGTRLVFNQDGVLDLHEDEVGEIGAGESILTKIGSTAFAHPHIPAIDLTESVRMSMGLGLSPSLGLDLDPSQGASMVANSTTNAVGQSDNLTGQPRTSKSFALQDKMADLFAAVEGDTDGKDSSRKIDTIDRDTTVVPPKRTISDANTANYLADALSKSENLERRNENCVYTSIADHRHPSAPNASLRQPMPNMERSKITTSMPNLEAGCLGSKLRLATPAEKERYASLMQPLVRNNESIKGLQATIAEGNGFEEHDGLQNGVDGDAQATHTHHQSIADKAPKSIYGSRSMYGGNVYAPQAVSPRGESRYNVSSPRTSREAAADRRPTQPKGAPVADGARELSPVPVSETGGENQAQFATIVPGNGTSVPAGFESAACGTKTEQNQATAYMSDANAYESALGGGSHEWSPGVGGNHSRGASVYNVGGDPAGRGTVQSPPIGANASANASLARGSDESRSQSQVFRSLKSRGSGLGVDASMIPGKPNIGIIGPTSTTRFASAESLAPGQANVYAGSMNANLLSPGQGFGLRYSSLNIFPSGKQSNSFVMANQFASTTASKFNLVLGNQRTLGNQSTAPGQEGGVAPRGHRLVPGQHHMPPPNIPSQISYSYSRDVYDELDHQDVDHRSVAMEGSANALPQSGLTLGGRTTMDRRTSKSLESTMPFQAKNLTSQFKSAGTQDSIRKSRSSTRSEVEKMGDKIKHDIQDLGSKMKEELGHQCMTFNHSSAEARISESHDGYTSGVDFQSQANEIADENQVGGSFRDGKGKNGKSARVLGNIPEDEEGIQISHHQHIAGFEEGYHDGEVNVDKFLNADSKINSFDEVSKEPNLGMPLNIGINASMNQSVGGGNASMLIGENYESDGFKVANSFNKDGANGSSKGPNPSAEAKTSSKGTKSLGEEVNGSKGGATTTPRGPTESSIGSPKSPGGTACPRGVTNALKGNESPLSAKNTRPQTLNLFSTDVIIHDEKLSMTGERLQAKVKKAPLFPDDRPQSGRRGNGKNLSNETWPLTQEMIEAFMQPETRFDAEDFFGHCPVITEKPDSERNKATATSRKSMSMFRETDNTLRSSRFGEDVPRTGEEAVLDGKPVQPKGDDGNPQKTTVSLDRPRKQPQMRAGHTINPMLESRHLIEEDRMRKEQKMTRILSHFIGCKKCQNDLSLQRMMVKLHDPQPERFLDGILSILRKKHKTKSFAEDYD